MASTPAKMPKLSDEALTFNDEIALKPSEKRNDEILKVMKLVAFIIDKFNIVNNGEVVDIDLSNDVSNVAFTLYKYIRMMDYKQAKEETPNTTTAHSTMIASIGNSNFALSHLDEEFKKTTGYKPFDHMFAKPLIGLLTGFECMFDELRQMEAGLKQLVEELSIPFDLYPTYCPILTGITLTKDRISYLRITLGPLTQAILLAKEKKYFGRLPKDLKDSLKMLKGCDKIVAALKKARSASEASLLIQNLGNVLLHYGSNSNKIFFPLLFAYNVLMKAPDDDGKLNELEFSGKGGYIFYQKYKSNYSWIKNTNGLPDQIAQLIFHSMFLTTTKNLNILSRLTLQENWNKSNDLDEAFKKNDNNSAVEFTPITLTHIPEIIPPRTYEKPSPNGMIINEIVFAGRRKRFFSDAFLEYFGDIPKNDHLYERGDIRSLSLALQQAHERIVKYGVPNRGSTAYDSIDTEGNVTGSGVSIVDREESPIMFYE